MDPKDRLVGYETVNQGELYVCTFKEDGDIHLHPDKERAEKFTPEVALYVACLLGPRAFILHPVGGSDA